MRELLRLVINILLENYTMMSLTLCFGRHNLSLWTAQIASWTAQIGWTARLE